MLRHLFLIVPFLLLVHVTSAVALPPCPTDPTAYFDNCEGTYTSADGDKYVGEFRDDLYHGHGIYFWADGDVWVGQFSNDDWVSGNKYTAGNVPPEVYASGNENSYQSSLPPCPTDPTAYFDNCQGFYDFGDGLKYLGEWWDDKKHGHGALTDADGGQYIGEFRDDKYHGYGTYTSPDGTEYVGEFRSDKLHGHGIYTWPNGDKYVGEFEEDLFHGQGTLTFTDGEKYVGEFRNDKKHGYGSLLLSNTDATTFSGRSVHRLEVVGNFVEDYPEGNVTLYWPNGDVWVGRVRGLDWLGGNKYTAGNVPPEVYVSRGGDVPPNQPPQQQTQGPELDEIIPAASGSGFVISMTGHIVTNHHVIDGCNRVEVHQKGNTYKAIVVETDIVNDLAILKADFTPTTIFSINNANAELLQDVYVAGYPFGDAISTSVKVTKGIVSSLSGIGNNYSNIQIDAALQPGNSGGPILDDAGNVVGVAVAKLDLALALEVFDVVPEDTNFGIKSSVLKNFLEANGIETIEPSTKAISRTELGKKITDGTLFLSCLMTYAQIKKLRAEKVMFSDLD